MYQALRTFWLPFYDICRFRKGPQDLPFSIALLRLTLLVYMLLQLTINLFNGPLASALPAVAVDVALIFILVSSLLAVAGVRERAVQTLTAIMGTGVVISVLSLPLWLWIALLRDAETDLGLPVLLLLFLGLWSLTITAHIFRHALSTRFGIGLMVAIVFSAVFVVASFSLFPPASVN